MRNKLILPCGCPGTPSGHEDVPPPVSLHSARVRDHQVLDYHPSIALCACSYGKQASEFTLIVVGQLLGIARIRKETSEEVKIKDFKQSS